MTSRDEDCAQKRYWRRLEVLRAVDDLVGYVLAALIETNELANTYIILTSDNGLSDGQHRYNEKLSPYEESIRTMLIIRPPGGAASRTIDRTVLGIDIAPTIADIAGAAPNVTVDGRSLLPLIQDSSIPWRRAGLLQHTLGVWDSGDSSTAPREYWAMRTSADQPRLFVEYPGVTSGVAGEYYDLALDPYQLSNLYTDTARQSEIAAMNAWLTAMKTCKGAVCRAYEDAGIPESAAASLAPLAQQPPADAKTDRAQHRAALQPLVR
jgi:arylsulfatase A-like enzyme